MTRCSSPRPAPLDHPRPALSVASVLSVLQWFRPTLEPLNPLTCLKTLKGALPSVPQFFQCFSGSNAQKPETFGVSKTPKVWQTRRRLR